jgi:hypothetical protein
MAQYIKEVLGMLYSDKFPPKKIDYDLMEAISKQLCYPRSIVKKGIADGNLLIDKKIYKALEFSIDVNSPIKFQGIKIELPNLAEDTRFDVYITIILEKCFEYNDINSLYDDQKLIFTGLILEYFSINGYNISELQKSNFNKPVLALLEDVYKRHLEKDDSIKNATKREIVDILLSKRDSEYGRFSETIEKIINGYYDLNSDAIFNDVGRISNSKTFKFLIRPLLQGSFEPITIIKNLMKGYEKVLGGVSKEEKITNNIEIQKKFSSIEIEINAISENRISKELLKLIKFYKKKCDDFVGFKDTGEPVLQVIPVNRTYNFNDKELIIYIIIKNSGSGIARNVTIETLSNSDYSIKNQNLVDILAPDENRTSKFTMTIKSARIKENENLNLYFKLRWGNDFNKEFQTPSSKITINKQKRNLPWEDLYFSKPYDKRAIDDPDKLFGREKLLYNLQRNIEKSVSITSTIIYGQKRVGKSSIVKTLNRIYEKNSDIIFLYKSIGDLKNIEAIRTLQRIGETVYKSTINEFRKKNPELVQYLKDKEEPSFLGSLSPLIDLINELSSLNPNFRLIICLDEFDELNKDFFENSELGKTFALNLGKGINDKDNVGFILVGSENMTQKAKTGMRLNTYEQKRVDTFNKVTEYDSYCKLISEPTKSCLKFSPDVFKIIYELTDGNPYFTNLIMSKVFNDAYEKRISFIDKDFIENPIEHFISVVLTNNDFAHFLEDGLSEDSTKYELVLDRRRRLLTALVLSKKEKIETKWGDIKRKLKYPKKFVLLETQFEDTLNEFKQRGIVYEDENHLLSIIPKIFEKWLLGPGVYQIIADLEDKDEILDNLHQDNKLLLSDEDYYVLITQLEEVANKNRVLEFKSFIDQFDNNESKRRIVEFLRKIVVISSQEAISHIKKTFSKIWSTINLGAGERFLIKDGEIVCLPDTYSQNQDFCEIIKDAFLFAKTKTIKTTRDLINLDVSTKNLIIYEPLIDCPFYYKNEFAKLLKSINPVLVRGLKIHVICFIITDEAKTALNDLLMNTFYFDYEIHDFKSFQRKEICPFLNNEETINDPTWSLLVQKIPQLSNKSTLVKIGEVSPIQSFPILWCTDVLSFIPLYPSKGKLEDYFARFNMSDKLENDWNFTSETNNIEFKASLAVQGCNWKLIKDLVISLKKLQPPSDTEVELSKTINDLWLCKNTKANSDKFSKIIKHSIMKSIAGFANSNGGKLYVGIEDDFTVQGLIYDQKIYKTEEEIRKVFDNMVRDYLGVEYSGRFSINFIDLQNGNKLLEILVANFDEELWIRRNKEGNILNPGKEEFYLRGLQQTSQLGPKEFAEWREKVKSRKADSTKS